MVSRPHIHFFPLEAAVRSPPIRKDAPSRTTTLLLSLRPITPITPTHWWLKTTHSLDYLLQNTTTGKTDPVSRVKGRVSDVYERRSLQNSIQENILMKSCKHFICKLFRFTAENWTAGECWQILYREAQDETHIRRKQSKVRYILKTFGDIIEHHLWDIILYHFYTSKKSLSYT